jgi:hypothetical protein
MNLRPHSVMIDDEYVPIRTAACSAEPFLRPDYRAKKKSRPHFGKCRPMRIARLGWGEVE